MTRTTVADAVAMAGAAMNEIKTHEAVCAERYSRISDNQRDMKLLTAETAKRQDEAIGDIKGTLNKAIWLLVATLISAVGGVGAMVFTLMTK